MEVYAIKIGSKYIEVDYHGNWSENPNLWRARFWPDEKSASDYVRNAWVKGGQVITVSLKEQEKVG